MLAPIVIFCYNRPEHLQKTIKALQENTLASQTTLIVYADSFKKVEDKAKTDAIKVYLNAITGFLSIKLVFRTENFGLAKSIIEGATEVLNEYGKAIFLEDDLLTSPDFLQYMNDGLVFYENNQKIYSISGNNPPIKIPQTIIKNNETVYLCPRASSWGFATWKDRWDKNDWQVTDFEDFIKNKNLIKKFHIGGNDLTAMLLKQQKGLNNSWAIRWTYTHTKNNAFCVYPIQTKVHNIGMDNTGTHSSKTTKYSHKEPLKASEYAFDANIQPNNEIISIFAKFYNLSYFRKIINYFKFGIW